MMKDKLLVTVTFFGIVTVFAVTLSAAVAPSMMIGAVLKCIPYIIPLMISTRKGSPKKLSNSLAVGLGAYLAVDTYVTYYALHYSQSSTDSIAVMTVMFASIVIIPLGTLIAFLLLSMAEKILKSMRQ